jgi:hypothetical protein
VRLIILAIASTLILGAGACGQNKAGGSPAETTMTTGNLPFDTVKLVSPDLARPAPLMQALKERRSAREYYARPLTLRELSELLWAANGVNRDNGKRTAPAAQNKQVVDVYVVLPVGAFLYDAPGERLLPVVAGDHRETTGGQGFVATAAVNLVFVSDPVRFGDPVIPADEKQNWCCMAVGEMAQNVGLYCASAELGNVMRTVFDRREKLGAALKLQSGEQVVLAQTIGALKP